MFFIMILNYDPKSPDASRKNLKINFAHKFFPDLAYNFIFFNYFFLENENLEQIN